MDRHTIVLTADKRQEKLAALLEGERISYAWEENAKEKEVCEKVYVLPIPVTKLDSNPDVKGKLKQELIKLSAKQGVCIKVFGGVINREWESFFDLYRIPYWDFMKLPEVVEGNGWITAEATLAEVLEHGEYSIQNQRVLVTGYGCCGKKIAEVFGKLGAKVVVAARRPEIREEVRRDGYETTDFKEMPKMLADVTTVINTVPSMVLTEDCIRRMQADSLIIDIASKPGGTDFEAAKKYGIKARLALGLPGIYTTSSSAMLLKNAISKYAPLQENVREDKLWIFQIII